MTIALQMQLNELPTACLELGQGRAVEMGGNTRKQGVAAFALVSYIESSSIGMAMPECIMYRELLKVKRSCL